LNSGYNRNPFANAFSYLNASGGWEFSGPTGGYTNRITGERMSANEFNSLYLNPSCIPSTTMNLEWGMTGTVGGLLANGEVFARPVYGYVSTGTIGRGNALPGAFASNSRDELEHANYWLGLSSTLLAGRQGFGYALNEFNTLQRTSNTLSLSLNYTKELSRAKTVIRGLKVGGVLTSGVSVAFAYNDWRAGNISNSKFALDAGMTLYTHVPVVGWAAGLQYYIIDTFYPGGFPGFSQDYVNQQIEFHNAIGYSMRSFMH